MSLYESQKLNKVAKSKGLYRNGHGEYVANIRINGKLKKRNLQTKDRAVADRLLRVMKEEGEQLGDSETQNASFHGMADMWLASIKGATEKPASWDRREDAVIGLKPFFKGYKVREIGFNEIEEWKLKRGNVKSVRTHNMELETLSLIFRYAVKKGCILKNPAADFQRRKQSDKAVSVDDIPTKAQFTQLVRYMRKSPQSSEPGGAADMVEFYAYSGTRLKEGAEVLLRDILADGVRITGGALKTKNYKTRVIPMFSGLKQLLDRMLKKRTDKSPNSKLFTIKDPRGGMKLALKTCGLPKFNTHSLRHFFVTNALEDAIEAKAISEWIGHSDGGVLVLKLYGHLRKDFSNESAKKMTFSVLEEE